MRISSRPLALAALATSTLAVGCAGDLPDPDVVTYARPLAMRVTVLETSPDPDLASRAEAMPFETVRLDPWIVDVDGPLTPEQVEDLVQPTWYACTLRPGQGLGSCLLSARPLDAEEIPVCPVPDLADLDPENPALPTFPSPCRIDTSTPAAPELTVPIDPLFLAGGDLEVTLIGAIPDTVDPAACGRSYFSMDPDLPRDCMIAAQRVPVGPDTEILRLAQSFGIDIGDIPLPDPPEQPDRNLRITGARIGVLDTTGEPVSTVEVTSGEAVSIVQGNTVEVTVTVDERDRQTYVVQVDDDGEIAYEPRDEAISGDFSNTWGLIEFGSSQGFENRNHWRLQAEDEQPELPEDGSAFFYFVARDGRVGVDWFWFEVVVTPAD